MHRHKCIMLDLVHPSTLMQLPNELHSMQTSAASTASRLCAYGSKTSLSGYQTPVETIMAAAAQGGRCHYSEAIASAMYDDVMPMEYMAQGSVGKDPFMVYAH